MSTNRTTPIVFIGPMAAGKSTVALAVAKATGRRHVPMDAIRFYYYLNAGMRFETLADLPDFRSVTTYWKPYEIDAVERIVVEFADAVIDFGAGQAHYTDPVRRLRLQNALLPCPDVFLLLPDLDVERCCALSTERDRQRLGSQYDPSRAELVREFVTSESYRSVAKHTVVTGGRSVEESVAEVLSLLDPATAPSS